MAIIARRIRHGLDGAESCGTGQKWDPNYVFNGIKGQCVPASQPLVQMASQPGFLTSLMSAFSKPAYAPTTTAPMVAPVQQQGMSQTTMLAIGAVGLVAIILIARSR